MKGADNTALFRSRVRFGRLSGQIRAFLSAMKEPIVVLDEELRIRLANKAFYQIFKLAPREINGKSIHSLGKGALKKPLFRVWMKSALSGHTKVHDFEVNGQYPNIGRRTLAFHASPLKGADTRKGILLLSIEDVTNRRRNESAMGQRNKILKRDAITDSLTGLYNRRGYTRLSQHFLELAHRRKKRIFVIYADLDGLKKINDEKGHPLGDQALVRTADVLRQTFRKSDIVARLGGDEFAIATLENGHDSVAIQIARLKSNLRQHAEENHYSQPISMSVGVVHSNPAGTASVEDLTHQADALMYLAKQGKRQAALEPLEIELAEGSARGR